MVRDEIERIEGIKFRIRNNSIRNMRRLKNGQKLWERVSQLEIDKS